jgi:thymidine kinase
MAKLYFHYSTMNAGKSTALLQASYNYIERGMRTMLFIAALDDRAGKGRIGSRIGLSAEANMFGPSDDLFEQVASRNASVPVHCVFVDEAQFLSHDQVWQLARVADRLGVPVMAYGLRTDFRGELFPGSKALLTIADELREVRTICRCGRKATMVVRLGADGKVLHQGAQISIGDAQYVSLCRRHWEEEMGRWPAEDLVGFAGGSRRADDED